MKLHKSHSNPYKIVTLFEEEIAAYTGAPYAVSIDSCTNALFLCLMYQKQKGTKIKSITIPLFCIYVLTTSKYLGFIDSDIAILFLLVVLTAREHASATADAPSYKDALAISIPESSHIIV